ncbi:MAG TPA: hypothetical protein VHX65_16695 [Pirellulales bacterium]|jgi:hypothetical protein|nr:hypothetical protein [Pirellulales bacterium]
MIPKLWDHPVVASAVLLLARLRQQLRDAKDTYAAAPVQTNSLAKAEAAYLAGDDPGRIRVETSNDARTQAGLKIAVLRNAIDRQLLVIRDAEREARSELIDSAGLPNEHQKLLQAVADTAKAFGAAASRLDTFYDALNQNGLGGSKLGHFGWPLHPGLITDCNSRLAAWYAEVERGGHTLA